MTGRERGAALDLGALAGAELLELYGKLERGADQARSHMVFVAGTEWRPRAVSELWDAASEARWALRRHLG